MSTNQLTRKDLIKETGAKHYVISYLTITGKLPLLHDAKGKGDVNIYHPNALNILRDWMSRGIDDEQ